MTFASIKMLFLIWTIPVLFAVVLYGTRKRRTILNQYASEKCLSVISPEISTGRRWLKICLILLALFCLAVALSGPLYGYRWQEIEQKGIDIIVALDCSQSMLADDIKPTRLDRAKRKIYDLLTILKGDRVGLVAFAGTAFLQCPLTLDYDAFHLFLNVLTPSYLPIGGTDITSAIEASLAAFDPKTSSEKAIIIITDGEHTGKTDPIKAAEEARKQQVKIFCIGVGNPEGVPIPDNQGSFKKDSSGRIILSKLDEETLKKIATLTGGTYVRSVAGDMDLEVIYTNEIRGKMEASTVATGRKQIWENRYQWFLAIAIIALVLEFIIPSVRTAIWMIFLLLSVFNPPLIAGTLHEGMKAYEKGDYEKALKHFIDAQLEDPDNPEILYNIGNTYYKLGDFDAALSRYKEALQKADSSLKQKTWYNIGNTEFRKKKFEDAIKSYEESLKINPDDVEAQQNLEFTKQVLAKLKEEEQKPQQCQHPDQKDQEGDKEENQESPQDQQQGSESESSDKNQEGESQSESKERDAETKDSDTGQKQEFGKEMTPEDSENASTSEKPSEEKPETDQQRASLAKPSEEKTDSDNKKQAERILNRLEDKPGKALMPSYGKPQIEKDW